ncbi:hypothetical protein P171DRAFT_435630 [Karstenula rhodostoma CBS 690.94]|uniref:Uncharacterized protein n=1 Tax=Karstenula rhodostoma CBS 690.94 TaxID=1392251 RepID=A0A9P4PB35_9PLEO|nr:hypothetical protein P171DRAFT_435630 [Karstenula rhodostoma CBS 690.94]
MAPCLREVRLARRGDGPQDRLRYINWEKLREKLPRRMRYPRKTDFHYHEGYIDYRLLSLEEVIEKFELTKMLELRRLEEIVLEYDGYVCWYARGDGDVLAAWGELADNYYFIKLLGKVGSWLGDKLKRQNVQDVEVFADMESPRVRDEFERQNWQEAVVYNQIQVPDVWRWSHCVLRECVDFAHFQRAEYLVVKQAL